MSRELPCEIGESIDRLAEKGNTLAEAGEYGAAIDRFEEALSALPSPKYDWSAATWLYTAIGDTHFLAGEFESARVALSMAILCPGALETAFIWLRRGQVYFELGDTRLAEDCLASAYMLGGSEIFDGENPKYAAYILPRLRTSK